LDKNLAIYWTGGWQNVEQCVCCQIVERRKKNIVQEDGALMDRRMAKY
jgi:hypothetical protein